MSEINLGAVDYLEFGINEEQRVHLVINSPEHAAMAVNALIKSGHPFEVDTAIRTFATEWTFQFEQDALHHLRLFTETREPGRQFF